MSFGIFAFGDVKLKNKSSEKNIENKVIPNDSPEIKLENRNLEKDSVPDLVLKYNNGSEQVFYAHPTWNYDLEYLVDKP